MYPFLQIYWLSSNLMFSKLIFFSFYRLFFVNNPFSILHDHIMYLIKRLISKYVILISKHHLIVYVNDNRILNLNPNIYDIWAN